MQIHPVSLMLRMFIFETHIISFRPPYPTYCPLRHLKTYNYRYVYRGQAVYCYYFNTNGKLFNPYYFEKKTIYKGTENIRTSSILSQTSGFINIKYTIRISNELKDQELRTSQLLALYKAHLSLEVPSAVSVSLLSYIHVITEALLLQINCFLQLILNPFLTVDTMMKLINMDL